MSVIIKIAFVHLVCACLAIFVVGSRFACSYPRYSLRDYSGANIRKQREHQGFQVTTPCYNYKVVYSQAKGVRVFEDGLWSLDLFMAAEPSVVKRLQEMDAAKSAHDEGTRAAAAAAATGAMASAAAAAAATRATAMAIATPVEEEIPRPLTRRSVGNVSDIQMETVLEVDGRNGFEAWRRFVSEMERDTVNHKLAIIELLSRPDFDDDLR